MKFSDTLHGIARRWYIVVPGLILTAALAIGAWFLVAPGYNRSATQLLIPGANSMPEGANPYLFLGGLSPAADVLVRALSSQNVMTEIADLNPGAEVEISRDTTTAGPIILITVTADSDAAAGEVLDFLVDRTGVILEEFQAIEDIPVENQMTVIPVTVDSQSVLQQRTRLVATAGAAIVGLVLTLLLAGLVDGLSQRRRHAAEERAADVEGETADADPDAVDEAPETTSTPPDTRDSEPTPPDTRDSAPKSPTRGNDNGKDDDEPALAQYRSER